MCVTLSVAPVLTATQIVSTFKMTDREWFKWLPAYNEGVDCNNK